MGGQVVLCEYKKIKAEIYTIFKHSKLNLVCRTGLGIPTLSVGNVYPTPTLLPTLTCVVHRLKTKCSLCRMTVLSVFAACWSVKLGRLRPLTRRACVSASATWCWPISPLSHWVAAFLEHQPAGPTQLLPRVPSGAVAQVLAISTMQIREEHLVSKSGEHLSQEQHLNSGVMRWGVSWGLCQRAVVVWPWKIAHRPSGEPHQGGTLSRTWAGAPASPLRYPTAPTYPTHRPQSTSARPPHTHVY